MKYTITIDEVRSDSFDVEADSEEEAVAKLMADYKDGTARICGCAHAEFYNFEEIGNTPIDECDKRYGY